MKKLFNTLSTVVCILGLSLNAQTNKTASNSSSQDIQVDMSDSKSKYIQNQDYLSKTTLKDFNNYYGDSLKGFKEEEVKQELLSRFYFGEEFINVMNFRKRDFINTKYKIGPDYVKKPKTNNVTPPTFTAKPLGGNNTINALPCINEDFEQTLPGTYLNTPSAVNGWTIESTTTNGKQLPCNLPATVAWTAGSPEFSIVSTPILNHPYIGTIPNSPLGGNNVAVLNNTTPGFVVTRISTTFPVTQANTVFQFAYAGSWDGSGHACCDQPFFTINMFDCQGAPLGCSSISLTPPGTACQNGATGYSTSPQGISWTNWQIKYIDLTPYIGSCVTMKIANGDCNGGAHHGSLYFDAKCGGNVLCGNCTPPSGTVTSVAGPVSFCAGSGQAQISAPAGYSTYSWSAPPGAPPISAAQATLANLTITNPIPGTVYTVNLVSPSGCMFVSTNTVVFTSVNIAGIASDPSCLGGASGQATVVGNGSGTGYNYTWLNSSNSTVGTNSVATGLAAGVYSIIISGFGAAGCGSAVATTTVGNVAPGVINHLKPYCGTSAFIVTAGGTNYQWYNNTTLISQANGGNSPTISIPGPGIPGPTTGQIVTLTYLSNLGCQDSVRYTLAATPPGNITPFAISQVCPGGVNGTAVLNITTAQGAPAGLVTVQVGAVTAPPYTYLSGPNNMLSHPLTGLAAGTYTVKASDGSCNYTNQFAVTTHTFNYNVSPLNSQVCPGAMFQAAVTFPTPPTLGQYKYAWSPTTFVTGTNQASAIISPVVPVGTQSNLIYSITVTPSVINCPVTKTISIIAVNPAIPTITAIPDKCDVSAPFQVVANPPGGQFVSGIAGPNNPMTIGGFVSPTLATIGAPNTFTYTHSVFNCSASVVGSYNVSKFWTSALSSTVPPLCITNPQFNLMNIVQNTQNGKWLGASGPNGPYVNIGGTHFNPAGLPTGAYSVTYVTQSTPNPTVCPDFTTLLVNVTHTSTPAITSVSEFCTNEAPFNMVVSPAGGGWLPVAGLSNIGLVSPPSFPTNVTSQVATYTVMDGPCLNKNTTTLNITHYNPAAFTGTINPLCFNSPNVPLMSIAQNTNGIWSGTGVSSNTFFPQQVGTTVIPLSYVVPSSPNPTLCPDSKIINVSVLHPVMPSITQVGPFCNNGSPVQLTVTPNTGNWTASPFLNSAGVFDPSQTSVGNNPVEYVVGTSTCHVEQTIFVSIEAFVPATIMNSIPDLCNNSPAINLAPFTISNLGIWSGNGISGTSFNPAMTGSGNFVLSYNTSSYPSGLCPDVASIAVNVYSLAAPIVTEVGPYCNNHNPVKLQVSPVGGLFGGATPGTIDLEGLFNPAAAVIGNNIINYSITTGPCTAYAQTIVKIQKFVDASFLKPAGPFCKSDEPFNMNSIVANQGGKWTPAPGMAGNMFNPLFAKTGTPNALIYTTYSSPIDTLCMDQGTVFVTVNPTPTVTTNQVDGGCVPVLASYNVKDVNSGTGIWSFSDGSEPIVGLTADHVFTKPGKYTVQFNYTDDIGCKALPFFPKDVIVHELPKADFSVPDEIYISDPQVQITNLSNVLGDNKYQWKITGLPANSEMNPMVTFPKIGRYQVTLTATNIHDCKDEITKTIEVKNNFNVFIPNSFSPNFDGLNDIFIPVFTKEGLDLKSFEMEIFDRWGHSLYRTKDASKGWDGSVQNKGEPLKEEVYVFRIKYKDMEGNLYNKMGNVTLLR